MSRQPQPIADAEPVADDADADAETVFRVAVAAQAGGPPGVLLTHRHIRWLFHPDDADVLAATIAMAAVQAREHGTAAAVVSEEQA